MESKETGSSGEKDDKKRRLRELYESLDVDQDGKVDVKELAAAVKRRMPNVPEAVDYAKTIMERADVSGDGGIDFTEFLSYILEHEQKLALTFRDLDRNKDGLIDYREVKRLLEELGLGRISDRQAKAIITRMTAGEKSSIELDQFQRHFALHPSASGADIGKYWYRGMYIDIGEGAVVPHGDDRPPSWKTLMTGGVAGAVARSVTAPLDRLKIFLQVHASRSNDLGIFTGFRYLAREGGMKALWRGNGVNVAKVVPESAIKYWAYEQIKRVISSDDAQLGMVERFCAGSTAGAFAQTLVYPMEVLKTRLALRKSDEMNTGVVEAFRTVYRKDGVRAFYRGYAPSLMGIVPFAGTELAVYETLRNLCMEMYYVDRDPGLMVVLACGIFSSTVAQIVSYPLGLVRTRLQAHAHDQPSTVRGQFSNILRRERVAGLYRGVAPNLLKALPAASVGYIAYEMIEKLLD